MNKNNFWKLAVATLLIAPSLASCSSDDTAADDGGNKFQEATDNFGKANDVFTADEWYPGGQLGTTRQKSYSVATNDVLADASLSTAFDAGKQFFEKIYTEDQEPRKGLGPAYVRNSCIKCHPSYGHGKRVESYKAGEGGNGYLLVIYHPTAGVESDGVTTYTANSYVSQVTGMPQTGATAPFKAPVDESQITIDWKTVTSMPSGLSMTFADGETYSLIYPEVNIPESAFNTNPKPVNYKVLLESTIGLYGTGLLDAITEDDMLKQYQAEAQYADMNPGMWDKANNTWASTAWYTLADGTKKVKKFTYAMTRASLQDGPGANAIWNITNVTRSDRKYLYTTAAWAKAMSEDADVLNYIATNGKDESSKVHCYYAADAQGNADKAAIAEKINNYLSMNTAAKGGDNYTKAFGDPEMSDRNYYELMVWHRGLAVPAARDLDDASVQRGKKLFITSIKDGGLGCAVCHRPSWTTGEDDYWVDNAIKAYCESTGKDYKSSLPKFAKQTIYPYTDLVQHKLYMENDIRTGWCRTTPLWGRGLSAKITGASDRMHDCRARNEIEAIMWHGYSKDSQAYESTEAFYKLSKADRDAVVKFLQSI